MDWDALLKINVKTVLLRIPMWIIAYIYFYWFTHYTVSCIGGCPPESFYFNEAAKIFFAVIVSLEAGLMLVKFYLYIMGNWKHYLGMLYQIVWLFIYFSGYVSSRGIEFIGFYISMVFFVGMFISRVKDNEVAIT